MLDGMVVFSVAAAGPRGRTVTINRGCWNNQGCLSGMLRAVSSMLSQRSREWTWTATLANDQRGWAASIMVAIQVVVAIHMVAIGVAALGVGGKTPSAGAYTLSLVQLGP